MNTNDEKKVYLDPEHKIYFDPKNKNILCIDKQYINSMDILMRKKNPQRITTTERYTKEEILSIIQEENRYIQSVKYIDSDDDRGLSAYEFSLERKEEFENYLKYFDT